MTTSTKSPQAGLPKSYQDFLGEIKQFVAENCIYTDELRTLGWGTDASFYRQIPNIVVRSDGEEQISKIVKACKKFKVPFTFRAAGTGKNMNWAKTRTPSACNQVLWVHE